MAVPERDAGEVLGSVLIPVELAVSLAFVAFPFLVALPLALFALGIGVGSDGLRRGRVHAPDSARPERLGRVLRTVMGAAESSNTG